MKVLMVASSYPKYPGDVTAPFIESIARGMARRGHAVDVILPAHPELQSDDRPDVRLFVYPYWRLPGGSYWGYAESLVADVSVRSDVYLMAPSVAVSLRSLLSARLTSERYDLVHAHWVVPNAAMIADVVSAWRLPFVVSLHGSDVSMAERLAPARWLARRAFRRAGAVTACSGDLHRRALALGAHSEATTTIPYGVDIDAFGAGATGATPVFRSGASLKVLAVGRLVEKKGFATLVAASVGRTVLDVVIAGDGDLRGALSAQIRSTGAPVRLVGALPHDRVAAAMAEADIVTVPSVIDRSGNVDGLPNVVLEAMGAGRALVASRIAGIPEIIDHGENGWLVPPDDVVALRAALDRLAADADLRRRLGQAARRTAEASLSWDHTCARYERSYDQARALATR